MSKKKKENIESETISIKMKNKKRERDRLNTNPFKILKRESRMWNLKKIEENSLKFRYLFIIQKEASNYFLFF